MFRRPARPSLAVAAVLAVVVAGLPACRTSGGARAASDGATAGVPTQVLAIETPARKVTFRVELARTPVETQRGLMYREHLAPDAGMLFLFDQPRVQTFWMKNTLIPLDMIFIGTDRRIVGIVAEAEPQTLTGRKVDSPSQYVLEIGGGLAAQLGIRPGQVVEFPPGATMP